MCAAYKTRDNMPIIENFKIQLNVLYSNQSTKTANINMLLPDSKIS
jgi:hypothetical protein